MKNKIIKKRNELDIEQGITFHPEIYTNRKYYDKINDDFNTREKDYLNKKYKIYKIIKIILMNKIIV